jgi:hypothetical protein
VGLALRRDRHPDVGGVVRRSCGGPRVGRHRVDPRARHPA